MIGGIARSVSASGRDAGPHGWAVALLSDQGMPSEEIATMLDTKDAQVVHRLLDLHRERLEERLMGQRRLVELIEVLLTGSVGRTCVRWEG